MDLCKDCATVDAKKKKQKKPSQMHITEYVTTADTS